MYIFFFPLCFVCFVQLLVNFSFRNLVQYFDCSATHQMEALKHAVSNSLASVHCVNIYCTKCTSWAFCIIIYTFCLFFTAVDLFSSVLFPRILIFDIPRVRVGVRVKGRRVVLKKVVVRGIREIRVRRMLLVKMTRRSRSGPGNHLHDDDDCIILLRQVPEGS